MKKLLYYLLPAVLLIGILGGIALKLKKNKTVAEARVFHLTQDETAAPMQEAPAEQGAVQDELLFTGSFEPFRESKISAESPGNITRMMVDAGSRVLQGQSLAQLDDALLQLQLQAVDVQLEGLTADVNRYTILTKADAVQGVQLEKAQLGLKAAQVQRATLEEQIRKTQIKAPFNGLVFSKLNEVGGFAAPGVPLLHLIDIAQLKFMINVAEQDLKYFKIGQNYSIVTDAFPDRKLSGKVSMIAGKANMGNSFPVQLIVQNFSDQALRAGMFGKLRVSNHN